MPRRDLAQHRHLVTAARDRDRAAVCLTQRQLDTRIANLDPEAIAQAHLNQLGCHADAPECVHWHGLDRRQRKMDLAGIPPESELGSHYS